ncbi:MAG: hypothetical protein SVR81_11525, partial [Chloroflexota bacterium]|nr:hypothetical protein [Chloroflexota bacterium]
MTEPQPPIPVTEPSVWDYFVEKIKFWDRESSGQESDNEGRSPVSGEVKGFPWRTGLALALALIAQLTLEPSLNRTPWPGVVLYGLALACLVAAIFTKEWALPAHRPDAENALSTTFKMDFLLIGIALAVIAFLLFGSGRFGFLNTLTWLLSILFLFLAFRKPKTGGKQDW